MYSGDVFPHVGGRVIIHAIQHLMCYVIALLCYFSKGALPGKGNHAGHLGGSYKVERLGTPGIGWITCFFLLPKKRGRKPV